MKILPAITGINFNRLFGKFAFIPVIAAMKKA